MDDPTKIINVQGCRALISSILIVAIRDAMLCKRPKPPSYRRWRRNKKTSLGILYAIYSSIMAGIIDHLNLVEIILDIQSDDQNIAYEAREFLKADNDAFYLYCTLLDINPIYLEEKISKQLFKFDNGI